MIKDPVTGCEMCGAHIVFRREAHTLIFQHGGDLVSTWVAKPRVHAEGQITSLIQL